MPTILKAEYKDYYNLTYTVDIIDLDGAADEEPIHTTAEGVRWGYSGKDNDPLNRIMAANAQLTLMIQDNALHEAFRDRLYQAAEGRLRMKITATGNTSVVEFIGKIMVDEVEWEDQYFPYTLQINAIDGFASLKDIPYIPPDNLVLSSRVTFMQHVARIINLMDVKDNYGDADFAIQVNCNWYEANMANTTDNPLDMANIPFSAFAEQQEANDYKYYNAYDALAMICTVWNARIYFSQGLFKFEQINDRVSEPFDSFFYNIDGNFLIKLPITTVSVVDKVDIIKLSGGTFKALPAVRSVVLTYDYAINENYLHDSYNSYSHEGFTEKNLGNIELDPDVDIKFLITGIIRWVLKQVEIPAPNELPEWRYRFRLKLRVGNKWLKREVLEPNNFYNISYGPVEWSDTEAYYYIDLGLFFTIHADYQGNYDLDILTPPLEEAGDILFDFWLEKIFQLNWNTGLVEEIVLTTYTFLWWLQQPYMITVGDGEEAVSLSREVLVYNNENSNSKVINIHTRIGDGPNTTNKNRILVLDIADDWVETDRSWTVGGSGTGVTIQRLLILEVAKLYVRPLKLMNTGIVFKDFAPSAHRVLEYNSELYMFMQGNITSASADVYGTWFLLDLGSVNPDNISNNLIVTNNPNTPSANLGNPSTSPLIRYRPLYQLFESFTGATIELNDNIINIEVLEDKSTLEIRSRLQVFKNGQKLIYLIGYNIDTVTNDIDLLSGYEGYSDLYEVYLFP
jgi:hypothetical protein